MNQEKKHQGRKKKTTKKERRKDLKKKSKPKKSGIRETLNLLTRVDSSTGTKKVSCHISCVTCYVPCVTCYMSPVTNGNSHSHRPSP